MSGKNLAELNEVLFNQLDRLNIDSLKGDALIEEISRSSAVIGVSKEIVSNARVILDATKLKAEYKGLQTTDVQALEKLS